MVLRVKEGFSFDHKGIPVTLTVGQLVNETDPWVQGHETFFEPADESAIRQAPTTSAVETATAAPGERRVVTNQESRIVPSKQSGKQG